MPPESIDWGEGAAHGGLFGAPDVLHAPPAQDVRPVPAAALDLAQDVLAHRDPQRLGLLYRIVWRIQRGERSLLDNAADIDVRRAAQLHKAVSRDIHKMHAFVRFRAVPGVEETFVAWYEPDHHIVDLAAPSFMRRFAGMRWAIVTPYRRVAWDGEHLEFGDGGERNELPDADAGEALWRRYYANIFNPARTNPKLMRQEMPVRFWKHLPEAAEVPGLLRDAARRVDTMVHRPAEPARRRIAAPAVNVASHGGLEAVNAAVRECRACPLWRPATQAVAGEGPADARLMMIGEQPGDEEDLAGRPFVGPAGRLFDAALARAGIDRGTCFITNAVKHFRFEQRGKRRLHVRASASEQQACAPWLASELSAVQPRVVVCLGATAAQAVLGRGYRLMAGRGQWHEGPSGARVLATVHPSWVLRQTSDSDAAFEGLVADLVTVAEALAAA